MTNGSLTLTHITLTPFAWKAAAESTNDGTCLVEHVGVNAPGTPNRTHFCPQQSARISRFWPGCSCSVTAGIESPTLAHLGSDVPGWAVSSYVSIATPIPTMTVIQALHATVSGVHEKNEGGGSTTTSLAFFFAASTARGSRRTVHSRNDLLSSPIIVLLRQP